MRKTNPFLNLVSLCAILFICLFSISVNGQQQFDVALTKTTVTDAPVKYGTSIPFNLTIYNQGSDTIMNVELIDHYGDGYEFQSGINPDWNPHATIVNAVTSTYTEKIPPNEFRIVTVNLIARPGDSRDDWINTAEVVDFTDRLGVSREAEDLDSTGDEIPDNDAGGLLGSLADNEIDGDGTGAINDGIAATDEDDHDRDTIQIFDLALTKVLDPITGYSYGDTLTFTTTVYNQGNITTRIVRVRDVVPEGYINPVTENVAAGWSNDPANPIYTFAVIEPFSQVEIDLKLILDPTQADGNAWVNFAEIIGARFDNNGSPGGSIGNNIDADSEMASNSDGEKSVGQGDPDDNNIGNTSVNPGDQDDHDPAEPEVFDLALIKERATALSSFNYGTPIDYSYTVVNQGNMAATDIVLSDSLPCGAMFEQALNPDWSYNPSTRIATRTIANFPNPPLEPLVQGITAHQFIDTLVLTVVGCFEDQETAWTNYMEISQASNANGVQTVEIDGVFDDNFKNDAGGIPLSATDNALDGIGVIDEDNHDVELLQVYDLALKKELITQGPYTEGQDLDFRIRVYNQGNIVIEDLVIEDFVPEGYGFVLGDNTAFGWTNSYTTNTINGPTTFPDTLNVMEDIFLATEDSVDIMIRLQLELDGTDISDWYNYAHVWVATDTVGNNRFDDADSNPFMTTELELSVIPGSPEDDNIFSPGKSVNPAVEEDDHDVANISYFDLSLTKTATSSPSAFGQQVTFDIVVKNEGVEFAHDITVTEHLPCGFTFNSGNNTGWAVNGSTGNPEYFYTDTLYAGEEVTIPISLTIEECLTPTVDSYRNVAEISDALDDDDVTGDDQDSTPDDNPNNNDDGEDDIDDAFIPIFDLSLTKTISSPPTNFMVGSPVSYNIVVTNEGNTPASNTEITDYLPCGLDFSTTGNAGWVEDGITGNISFVIMTVLNPGESITVPLTLTIGSCVGIPLDLDNLVEISVDNGPVDDFDSTPDNGDPNEDDIDIAPLDFFDLSLEKILLTSTNNLTYGQDLVYEIIVTNEGTIPAISFEVTDYLACGLLFTPSPGSNWNLDNNTGYISQQVNVTLAPGESTTLSLTVTLTECNMLSSTAWHNVVEITAAEDPSGPADDDDSTPNNGDPNEDDYDVVPLDVYDLSLIKTVTSSATEYELGEDVIYNIMVTNEGNIAATSIEIEDIIPCGMILSSSNSLAWNVVISGNARYVYNGTIFPGQSQNFEIRLTITDCIVETGVRINIAEIFDIGNEDDIDSTPNNGDPDEDDIDDVEINVNVGSVIGDFVFNDLDGDGIQDNNEPGISGVMVTLYTSGGDVVAVFETGPDGLYQFEEIDPGNYYITFEVEEDFIPSPPNAGNDDNDSNVTEDNGPGSTSTFTVVSGQDDLTIDGGFFICSLIKGVTYYDINEDDIRQTTENGINGLVVNLYRKVGGQNVLWDSETTHHDYDTPSDDGIWDFCVGPGQYFIEVVMPPIGLVRVRPFIGGSNYDSDINNANGPNTTPTFTLFPGISKTDLGAGYYPMATVGNRVWMDENANGIQEDNEPKVEGVTVQVYNMDHEMIDQAITNSEGVYTVEYLMKEEYYLKFEAPEGFGFTFANTTSDDMDSDVNHSMGLNTTSPRFFNPGDKINNVDAGIVNGVLPVVWNGINVFKEEKHNLLTWKTSQELNVENYIIERRLGSEDRFIDIGTTKAAGNSNVEQTYNFIDEDVSYEDKYYYRVRQIDFDGKYSNSNIVVTERLGNGRYNMYPNPTAGKLNIDGHFDEGESYSVQVINNLGQVVMQSSTPRNGVELDELPNGVYSIIIKKNDEVLHQDKIIKL
jgi:uncharacterized repeat protein (TIGR01451 family)